MQNTKELPTHYNDLPESIKRLPLENMFNRLEEFQEQKESGLLNENELYKMKALERCIELRLGFELHLGRFIESETSFSESGANDICFKLNDETFVENFIPEKNHWACKDKRFFFFLTKQFSSN